jgi:hypothetical protein
MERWLPVVGYEGMYEVSNHGRVRSVARIVSSKITYRNFNQSLKGTLLNPVQTNNYQRVCLFRNASGKHCYVHRLVLEAFVGPCPPGMQALHWDDDRQNNRVSNLRWGTPSENASDSIRNGKHHNSTRTFCRRGHEFSEENTSHYRRNERVCKLCARIRNQEYRKRKNKV